jgi:hypothetical protein
VTDQMPMGLPLGGLGPYARHWFWREPARRDWTWKLPDPLPHDLAEVWDNAAALTARVCQRCGRTFGPKKLVVPVGLEQRGQILAEREGLELLVSPYAPEGSAFVMDDAQLDLMGCNGA